MAAPSSRRIEPLLPISTAAQGFTATAAVLTLTAHSPTITGTITRAVTAATITLTAHSPTITSPKTLTVTAATGVLTAHAPTLTPGTATLTVTAAVLTLTAHSPAISTSGAPPQTITVLAATLTLTAHAPAVTGAKTLTVTAAVLTLTAHGPSVLSPKTLTITAAILTVTAHAPSVLSPKTLTITAAVLTLTAHGPTITTGSTIQWFKVGPIGPSPPTRVAGIIRQITVANFVGSFYLEAMLRTTNPARPAYCRLYNKTDSVDVFGSEAQTPGTVPTRTRSGAFTLLGTKEYEIEFGGQTGGTHNWHGADLVVAP